MQRKVLSVQNAHCETLGTFEGLLKNDGFEIEKINAQIDTVPIGSNNFAAVIILGGPMAVYDNHTYLQNEQELIKDAIKKNIPVLGICLGSQLIAQATGGRVYKGKQKEIGWRHVYVTPASSNDIFRGVTDKTIRVFQWHGDTYDLPANAKILAYSDLYPQAFRVGSAIGVQFHLEVDNNLLESWFKEYSAEVKAEGIRREEILHSYENIEELATCCKLVYNNFTKVLK